MAQLNTVMLLADEFTENDYIKKEHTSLNFSVDPNEESHLGVLILSSVVFDKEEPVEDIFVEFRMFYLGTDHQIKLEGAKLTFPIVEKNMAYVEMYEPFSKKIYTKRSTVQIATVFPGEGQYVLMLVEKNSNNKVPNILDLRLIDVKYK